MPTKDSSSTPRGRHSHQAVKQRLADDEARLNEEREHAREALRAAQERGDISIPRTRRSRKGLVVLIVLLLLALAAFFGRSYLADFTHSFGIDLPFLSQQGAQEGSSAPQGESSPEGSSTTNPSHSSSLGASATSAAHKASSEPTSSSQPASSTEPSSAAATFDITRADFGAIPATQAFGGFSLNPAADAPIPSPTARDAIESAFKDIEDNGPCSFVFVDMESGRGICYNAGEQMYSASMFKAPYAYYLLSNAEQGAMLSDDDRDNLLAALLESDNDAYDALHYGHDTQDYYDWLSSHGITNDPYYGFYPNISAATMAALWNEILRYLDAGSEEAQWLEEQLSKTRTSFIRDGLDGSDAKVWDKGGWISDGDGDAVNDAGIVEDPSGRRFVIVIMTGQENSEASQERVGVLARALYDARSALA